MEPGTLSKILVRAIAIYLMAQGIMQIPSIVTVFSYAEQEASKILIFLVLAVLFPLITGIVLWGVSGKLSRFIVGNATDEVGSSTIDSAHIQAVAISTIGLIVVLLTLPQLVSQGIQLFGNSNIVDGERIFNLNTISYFVATTVKVFFALSLVIGIRFWVKLLHNFREIGLHEKTSYKANQRGSK